MSEFPSHNTNRSIQSDMGHTAPIIQVTEVLHPDDHDRDNLISPRRLALPDIPTIGIDNLSFDPGEEALPYDTEDSYSIARELQDLHTPLPNQPFYHSNIRRGSNSNVFVFDPDCVSLFSGKGSYDRRGSNSIEKQESSLNERVGSSKFEKRRGSGLSGGNNSSLTVPSVRQIRTNDLFDSNTLAPGNHDPHMPPQSPGLLSNHSAWSELLDIDTGISRRSSAAFSDYSRISNVSSSLSEHLRHLVRAFSSRTEKVKETTLQPPSPSSLSDYAGSDALSAISTEPQFRHRLDSFLPDQPEGDTISEIVRFRNEQEEEQKKKSRIPRWIRRLKFPHVIEPQSKLYLFWLFIVTLAFMYNAWAIPLRAAFPYQTPENVKYWLVFDYLCDVIYIMDILIFKSRVSFLNSGMKETHRSKTRANYMQKRMFKFDCLSLLPLDLLYLIEMKVNPWCRLPRVLKIQTFWEFYSRCDHLVRSAHAVRIMRTFTYMLFLIHIETCGYYAMSVHEGIGSNEWVYDGQGNAYIRCFYLATKTATSIGNNPDPTNTLEYMFMTVYWVSGVFVFALLIGQIRDIFDASNMVKTTYNHRMDKALNYVKNMNVPKDTQDRVRSWFIYNWQQQKVIDERQVMDALPMKLRKDLAIHVHFNTLSKVKLFSDCDKTLLYDLVLKLKPILYLPGDYVCRKGEIGKEMYIVSQGVVEVVGGPNNSLVLATLREGSVFGEISLLAMAAEGNRRTADVRCKGFTNLFILSKIDFENAMKDYPEAHKLLKKRAKKLLRMNARIERQSQCSVDQTKIKTENIIKTPPETPKMVQTVIQVMDPDSTIIRKLSTRRGTNKQTERWHSKDIKKTAGSQDKVNAAMKSEDEIEAFYDDMLKSKDWSDELEKLEQQPNNTEEGVAKYNKETNENDEEAKPDAAYQKKKTSETSESSADSGVQDTKMTSSCSSAAHSSVSNKDSKESFSTELGEILEDSKDKEKKQVEEKIKYTMEMFGDIESQPNRPKSNNSRRSDRSDRFVTGAGKKGGGASTVRDNDEYTKAFAHGFTIIIDSVDEKENYSRDCFTPDFSESDEDQQSHKPEKVVAYEDRNGTNEVNTLPDKHVSVKNINEVDDSLKSSKNEHRLKGLTKSASSSKSTAVYNNSADRKLEKPHSLSNSKHSIQNKNKLGLKLKIADSADMFAPYRKSSASKNRHTTNKVRQQHNDSKSNSCELKKHKSTKKHINENGVMSESNQNYIECETDIDNCIENEVDVTETHTLCVGEADETDSVDNSQNEGAANNIVTCFAEVHRETTLSPKSLKEETTSLSPPCTISPSKRQRKISVISIGSVLKDGRETLV